MARSRLQVEVNKFTLGLVTDANPLTFPDNASMEEQNFVLNNDGSRQRRLGIDYEEDFVNVTTTISDAESINPSISSFKWVNAGGDPEKAILVVQISNELKFYDLDSTPISQQLITTYKYNSIVNPPSFSFSVVDGILVVTTGLKEISTFVYDSGVITHSVKTLKVRDFFGVEDQMTSAQTGVTLTEPTVDLLSGTGLSIRPTSTTDAHTYNLRNQGWGVPRIDGNNENSLDPIRSVYNYSSKYPSNSDSVQEALYPDANDGDNRNIDRFFSKDLFENPVGSSRASWGHFIIDALERGASRQDAVNDMHSIYSTLEYDITSLPLDKTPGGATVSAEFAGRAWFAGFSGQIEDGDSRSPRMSSYVLFSTAVNSVADIGNCYQQGDPTADGVGDLVDTDGGYIRIDGAYNIRRLIDVSTGLIVMADNGIWRISGDDGAGFTATSYNVTKLSNHGLASPDSTVVVDNTVIFWGDDAIYNVAPNQFGDWEVKSLTFSRIQKLFDSYPLEHKKTVKGFYDSYERKAHWVIYNNTSGTLKQTEELILDVGLEAYYINKFSDIEGQSFPRVGGVYTGNPYQISTDEVNILVGSDDVVAGVDDVNLVLEDRTGISNYEGGYIVITSVNPVVTYTFASLRNTGWRDWKSYDNVGVDAPAYVVTGWLAGQDYQRVKQIPKMTVHCRRTETGYEVDGEDLTPLNQSSCLVQFRWDWSDSEESNRWSREFQAYRYRRHHFPESGADDASNGFQTIVTRHKIRGSGKSLAIMFKTEPDKDLHLYGWSMMMNVNNNV